MILAKCIVSAYSGNRLSLGEYYGLVPAFDSENIRYYRTFAVPDVSFKEGSGVNFVPSPRLSACPCLVEFPMTFSFAPNLLGIFPTHRFEFLFREEELKAARHTILERLSFTSGEYRQQEGQIADPPKS